MGSIEIGAALGTSGAISGSCSTGSLRSHLLWGGSSGRSGEIAHPGSEIQTGQVECLGGSCNDFDALCRSLVVLYLCSAASIRG